MDAFNPDGCRSTFEDEANRPASNGSLRRRATPQGQALAFRSFATDPEEQERLNALSQTPDEKGNVVCWKAKKRCSNPDCLDPKTEKPHKFSAAEHDLWNCPRCGQDRHCRNLIRLPNRGCHLHGGKTPTGFALPQTKTGEHSRHLRVNTLKADYERMMNSESLYGTDDRIALLKAFLNVIIAEYKGGASRALLARMKANRRAYKTELRRDNPDPLLLRELDQELDGFIQEGSKDYQVFDEYRLVSRDVTRLIAARDQHVQLEQLVITSDRAWVMLAHVEETFRVGAELIVDVIDEDYVRRQCEILGMEFASLSCQRVQELMQAFRNERQKEKRQMLTYASGRFGELAGTAITPKARNRSR